ncbi:sigma factor [Sphaerisporangium sp. NPDC051011]|uniref:RNA polymerase sigma factor n=1 Tax=Sphaerisporangium sp. NPDC051011 TaxID=3155792 RepID=UPI0033F2C941
MGEDPPGRFVEIYEHAYRPVLAYALRRCQDPDDAADVVAETFMTAWRRIEEVPEGDAARLWLFGSHTGAVPVADGGTASATGRGQRV